MTQWCWVPPSLRFFKGFPKGYGFPGVSSHSLGTRELLQSNVACSPGVYEFRDVSMSFPGMLMCSPVSGVFPRCPSVPGALTHLSKLVEGAVDVCFYTAKH